MPLVEVLDLRELELGVEAAAGRGISRTEASVVYNLVASAVWSCAVVGVEEELELADDLAPHVGPCEASIPTFFAAKSLACVRRRRVESISRRVNVYGEVMVLRAEDGGVCRGR